MRNDTIAAIATARGEGGIAIVRISGPDALGVIQKTFSHRGRYISHMLYHGYVLDQDGARADEAMAVYMAAPRSYTAEDVCEIQCHGGDVAAERTLDIVLRAGASPAEPGEFTRRAFMNGRIDLAQAEAVMQLVSARSEAAARASVRQLTGGVSARIRPIMDALTGIMALIEAADDFPDEIEEAAGARELRGSMEEVSAMLDALIDPRAARMITGGSSVVLTGRPNVGKSSIMNALAGAERAIVTDIPGTTRDVLSAQITVKGVRVELSDTAGLRRTDDLVERIGVERAESAARQADMVIIVLDGSAGLTEYERGLLNDADERCLVCVNKTDAGRKIDAELISAEYNISAVDVSARTGEGMDALRAEIARRVAPAEPALVAQRHMEAAAGAKEAVDAAIQALDAGYPMDVCAVDAAQAMERLGEITGENAREAVIDRVFRDFCVGK